MNLDGQYSLPEGIKTVIRYNVVQVGICLINTKIVTEDKSLCN